MANTHGTRLRSAAALLALLLAPTCIAATARHAADAAQAGVTQATFARPATVISSPEQLATYLHDTPPAASPLSLLTPDARQRFLASLRFGERGLGGFSTTELAYDLTAEQAAEVLALFGEQQYALTLDARSTPRPASLDGNHGALAPQYQRLIAAAESGTAGAQQARAAASLYATQWAPEQTPDRLQQLGDRDVQLLFRAAVLTFYLTADPDCLRDMQRDLARLERDGAADRPHYAELYKALLRAHRADQAQALLAAHPVVQREAAPALHDVAVPPGVPSLWVASTQQRVLTRQPFALDAPAQVVVLAGTGCHYSRNAVRDIDADPRLRELFQRHARWVAPAQDIAGFDAVAAWNRQHPTQPLAIANDNAEWPVFGSIKTPTFYFLRHGKLVATVVGWPAEGQRAELLRAMHDIGLDH